MNKKHWLYGNIEFKIDVIKETDCGICAHWIICKQSPSIKSKFCGNYDFGTNTDNTCDGCIHRYTRYTQDKEIHGTPNKIPCWVCKFFKPLPLNILCRINIARDKLNNDIWKRITTLPDGDEKKQAWKEHDQEQNNLNELYIMGNEQ